EDPAEDVTNGINDLSNDELINHLQKMIQDENLFEQVVLKTIDGLDEQQKEEIASALQIEDPAEDVTNGINDLSNDELINHLQKMIQDENLFEQVVLKTIEDLDDEQRAKIGSALKKYRLDNNWQSMMKIFNIDEVK
ncbi:MAG: hypothetical protein F6K24_12870, partial [Okeania sp. SIO2D1]|nr:hypothetical protein [Okeania sp. SIO2D1]